MSRTDPKRLVIVESPTKAKTIRRFLPSGYRVEASMGHVRDLPASAAEIPAAYKNEKWARLGVRVDEGFEPLYVVSPKKKQVVSKLREALKGVDELYIATDEDREGESIGWHLLELLQPRVPVKRMVFHEITEDAILRALEDTRDIDRDLVDAQETRRVLDRLVGYTISPLLWRKIAPRLSAGRVQSVAVRLLVLREAERMRFRPAEYWDLQADVARAADGKGARAFEATMTHLDGIRLASGRDFDADTGRLKDGLEAGRDVLLLSGDQAGGVAERARTGAWRVAAIEERTASRSPSAPFTTSTLQQEASRKLGMSAKETMRTAQALYENGHITYMRTDSTNLSQEAVQGARAAVERLYGADYLSPKPRAYTKKARNAQEAHEAIRPAGGEMRTREAIGLAGREGALYDLIWKRTVATQMADARLKFVTARIDVALGGEALQGGGGGREARFRASGRQTLFPGFFRAYVEGSDDPDAALEDREQPLPELAEGDGIDARRVEPIGHETKPPARYTEASLVKLLESEGIGRPSTYASILDTIVNRGYVRKNGSQLVPTFTAFATNRLLEAQFAQLVDTEFTARMEAALDDIAAGELASTPYLQAFYGGEEGIEARVAAGLDEIDPKGISTIENPDWAPFVVRVGRYGPYVEGELDGEIRKANVPDETAPADLTRDELERLLREGNAEDRPLGTFPDTGQEMLLKRGPYGPYLQLGDDDQKGKPKRVSLPKGLDPSDVTERVARDLLSLPREVARHPESGDPIEAGIGRFGPYVKHGRTYASLGKDDDVLNVPEERAIELILKKEHRNRPLRVLGEHPETGDPVEVHDGRYGPYVKHARVNASLRSGQEVETLTLDEGLALLAEREAKGGGKGRKGKRRAATKTKGAAKAKGKAKTKGGAKKAAKPAGPKATPADLEAHLGELDTDVRDVVVRIEGLSGERRRDMVDVADALGLSEEDVRAKHKRGMFKLRMAYGKARKAAEGA